MFLLILFQSTGSRSGVKIKTWDMRWPGRSTWGCPGVDSRGAQRESARAGGSPEAGEAGLDMRDPIHPSQGFLRKEWEKPKQLYTDGTHRTKTVPAYSTDGGPKFDLFKNTSYVSTHRMSLLLLSRVCSQGGSMLTWGRGQNTQWIGASRHEIRPSGGRSQPS